MDAIVMLQRVAGSIPIEAKVFWFWFVSRYPQYFDNLPDDSEIKEMQAQKLADWDFPTISDFLKFADAFEEA
jgi:hypothetical protein